MNKQNFKVVGTNVEEIEGIVNTVLQQKEDKLKKQEHIDKVLKKDEMKAKLDKQSKEHKHSCPTCHSATKHIEDNFEICEDCGATITTITKGQKLLVCDTCNGVIPESFATNGQPCPHCGGTGAHWAK